MPTSIIMLPVLFILYLQNLFRVFGFSLNLLTCRSHEPPSPLHTIHLSNFSPDSITPSQPNVYVVTKSIEKLDHKVCFYLQKCMSTPVPRNLEKMMQNLLQHNKELSFCNIFNHFYSGGGGWDYFEKNIIIPHLSKKCFFTKS